ncbi:MAG: DUF432 domain-containing protein, partial [Candidatus Thermoplasmatota archaeon]|nr:DUF432 domain-containing protein [Candidatus Thermoplasmatota archaeon]
IEEPCEDLCATGPWSPPGPSPGELFGVMDRPFNFKEHHLEYNEGRYTRTTNGEIQHEAYVESGEVGVFPVSPLHTPSIIGKYIMAEFASPVYVSPRGAVTLYVSLPVEMGVFARSGRNYETIDIFSITKQKYALYGAPNEGFICRWASVFPARKPPETSFPEEALAKISFKNYMNRWAKVEKAVFPGEQARIFYGNGIMSYPLVDIAILNKGITKAKLYDQSFKEGLLPSPLSTLHATPIRLKDISIFNPEGTILVGGY